jgi:hypothetical protein
MGKLTDKTYAKAIYNLEQTILEIEQDIEISKKMVLRYKETIKEYKSKLNKTK